MQTAILTADDVGDIVRSVGLDAFMDEVIVRLEIALARSSDFEVPIRSGFEDGTGGLLEWMPVMEDARDATIKVVGYHPRNPSSLGLPTVLSAVLTFDAQTGHLVAVCDGTFTTAVRTGAASAVASKVLAREDSRSLGLLGAGAQAVTQVHALSRIFPLEKIVAVDIDAAVLASFEERVRAIGDLAEVTIECSEDSRALEQSDIICTATSVEVGAGPVLLPGTYPPHLHINAVGSDFPGKVEISRDLLDASFLVVDYQPQALLEGEAQQVGEGAIRADFAELVKGADQFKAKRDELTIFDSTGFALEDHVVVSYLHELANDMGIGGVCQLQAMSNPIDPYHFINSDQK